MKSKLEKVGCLQRFVFNIATKLDIYFGQPKYVSSPEMDKYYGRTAYYAGN